MTSVRNGLALAAGGARGAYQAGALLYFAEQGWVFNSVAGASIGALNAAYYAQGDGSAGHVAGLCELWQEIPDAGFIQVSAADVVKCLTTIVAWTTPWSRIASILTFVQGNRVALLDPKPVVALLDRWIDYGRICRSPIDLTTAVLPSWGPILDVVSAPWRNAAYFTARELGEAELRSALLAATAIPLAFPSQIVRGVRFSDAALVDPLPAQALYQQGAKWIVSIFLSDDTPQNRADFPGCVLHQVRPSVPIEPSLRATFDFSRREIERLIDLGYDDARNSLRAPQELFTRLIEGEQSQRRQQVLMDRLQIIDREEIMARLASL